MHFFNIFCYKFDRLAIENVNKNDFIRIIRASSSILSPNEITLRYSILNSFILSHVIQTGDINYDIITNIILTNFIENEISDLLNELTEIKDSYDSNESNIIAQNRWGKSCPNPGNFKGSILNILYSKNGFSEIIKQNMKAGGCNCSRANFIGSVLGAIYGINEEIDVNNEENNVKNNKINVKNNEKKGIPMEWILKTDKGLEIFDLALTRIALSQ